MNNNKEIDLLGIGNAITDILVEVDYHFLEKMNLQIGAMQLADYETINKTIKLFTDQFMPTCITLDLEKQYIMH